MYDKSNGGGTDTVGLFDYGAGAGRRRAGAGRVGDSSRPLAFCPGRHLACAAAFNRTGIARRVAVASRSAGALPGSVACLALFPRGKAASGAAASASTAGCADV